ncbi:unnamed protein product [Sphagnum jensenii]|uniref:ribonuclease Z n=1 Tax=Sphagnum jensenii TaxID=128206 RepID=A0ABP0VI19_9BRYO
MNYYKALEQPAEQRRAIVKFIAYCKSKLTEVGNINKLFFNDDEEGAAEVFNSTNSNNVATNASPDTTSSLNKNHFLTDNNVTANQNAANFLRDSLSRKRKSTQVLSAITTVQKCYHNLRPNVNNNSPFFILSKTTDIEILFLGTGCATPSKHRSSSSIIIKIPHVDALDGFENKGAVSPRSADSDAVMGEDVYILLDVGEGTTRQLYQSVSGNSNEYVHILLHTYVIWISHHHADHCSGFTHFIETEDCVELHSMTDTLFAGLTIPIAQITHNRIKRLTSIPVHHCKESYGVVLELRRGLKIVYSGDCRPSEALIRAGQLQFCCVIILCNASVVDVP